jgi:endonuclease-8
MRMEGSWHVYRAGEAWRRPARQGRLVIEAGPRVAVCFNAPVIELLAARGEKVHPALMALGPDVLAPGGPDLIEVRARVAAQPPDTLIGDVLLDQRLMAGIGNIYRCETLFLHGVHPDRPLASVDADLLDAMVVTASQLMTANITAARRSQTWVYGRSGRPCRRCGRVIVSTRVGTQARTAYWCRRCQPAP